MPTLNVMITGHKSSLNKLLHELLPKPQVCMQADTDLHLHLHLTEESLDSLFAGVAAEVGSEIQCVPAVMTAFVPVIKLPLVGKAVAVKSTVLHCSSDINSLMSSIFITKHLYIECPYVKSLCIKRVLYAGRWSSGGEQTGVGRSSAGRPAKGSSSPPL